MNGRVVAVLCLLLGIVVGASAQTSAVDSTLKAANSLYDKGDYESAELAGRRLLEQKPLADSLRTEADRIIAFSLVAQGKTDLAREHFESILRVNPSFDLDPVLTSPKILTVFQEARQRTLTARVPDSTQELLHTPEGPAVTFRAVLFPGWEQLYRGRTTVGLILGGAGVVTLGSALAFEILRAPARRDYLNAVLPADIAAKYSTYNRYYRGEVYSFIAFAVVYVASECDIFLSNTQPIQIHPSMDPSRGMSIVLTLRR